ncbi:hypothetical protein Hanom_Chr12g01092971 [Helianthus anomalus]
MFQVLIRNCFVIEVWEDSASHLRASLQVCTTLVRTRHVISVPLQVHHTFFPYRLTFVRQVHHLGALWKSYTLIRTLPSHALLAHTRARHVIMRHLVLVTHVLDHALAVKKYKGGYQAAREVQRVSSKRHIVPMPRACASANASFRTLREYTIVFFHETIRKECPYLNTTLSFISPSMWDKVALSHSTSIFQQCMF